MCQRRLFNHTLPACLSTRLNWGTVLNSLKQDPPYSFQNLLKCRSMQGIAVSQLISGNCSKYTRSEVLPRAVDVHCPFSLSACCPWHPPVTQGLSTGATVDQVVPGAPSFLPSLLFSLLVGLAPPGCLCLCVHTCTCQVSSLK